MALTALEVERVYRAYFDNDRSLPHLTNEAARVFVEAVASASPPANQAALEQTFLPFLAGNAPLERRAEASGALAGLAAEAGLREPFARFDDAAIAGPLAEFVADVNAADARRTVVFVAMMPYFVILREAIALRRRGHRAFLVSLSPLPAGVWPLFARHFDRIADTQQSLRLMRAVLGALAPDVFHVQCWMWTYVLGRLAIECRRDAAVVCEFYDITSLFAERETLAQSFKPAMVDFDFACERFILENAGGIVSRFSSEVVAEWAAFHGVEAPPSIEMQAYACPEFMASGDPPARTGGPIRLVYAGSLIANDETTPPALNPEVGMPRAFRAMLEQDLAIDVLTNPQATAGPDDPRFADYYALDRAFAGFSVRPGVPPDALSDAIGGYGYGILLFDYDTASTRLRDVHRRNVVSTKIFAYLEAGLPVIVNAEYERMAALVTENGVGLAVASSEIPTLAERLRAFDRDAAVDAVRRFNETHAMDREIDRLIALYDSVSSRSA